MSIFWQPPTNTNKYEQEITVRIEALYTEIKKLKLQGISARALLDSAEANITMMVDNIKFLRSDKAKIVVLSEIRSINNQLVSLIKDAAILNTTVNKIQADISLIEKEITRLEELKKSVSLKILPFRKKQ